MENHLVTSELIDDFFECTSFRQNSTALNYRRTIPYFVQYLTTQGKLLTTATVRDAVLYKQYLKEVKQLSPATIDNYLAALRKLYKFLIDYEEVKMDIFKKIERQRDRGAVFMKGWLSIDQVYQLMDAVDSDRILGKRNRAIIHLMSFTGLRCIEVSKLTFNDIHYDVNNNSKLQIMRKGRLQKSGQVSLPDDILQSMQQYWKLRYDTKSIDAPLFLAHSYKSKSKPLDPRAISTMIKQGLRLIGLDSKRYSAHSLRHTAAKLAMVAGAKEFEIQFMLGHNRIAQTEHYLKGFGEYSGEEGRAILKINEYAQSFKKNQGRTQYFSGM